MRAQPVYSQMQLRVLRPRRRRRPDAPAPLVGIVQPIRQTGYAETVAWIDGERERLSRLHARRALRQTIGEPLEAPQPFGYLALARLTKSLV